MPITQHYPFQLHCKQIIAAFKKAKTSNDAALFLHKSKVRTPLFMAESILRISRTFIHDKEIEEWYELIKKLEDHLGEVDNYITLLADFSKLKGVKSVQLEYISKKLDKSIDKFNKKLSKYDFYIKDLEEMNKGFKINFNDKRIIAKLHEEIKTELKETADFFGRFPEGFDDMELQVHELRRKLRWISIYAAAFDGLIGLKETKEKYKWEKKFITPSVIKNPFNKLPVKKGLTHHISLNKKSFFALSFVIAELGKIKDKGLGIYSLGKSIRKTTGEKEHEAEKLAIKQLQVKYSTTSLLKEAYTLLNSYYGTFKIYETLT